MNEKTAPLVVVGVDGSDDGLRAVRFGTGAALRISGELLLVNAVDDTLMAGAWGVVYDPEVLQSAGITANEQARDVALSMGLPEHRIKTEVVMGSPGGVMARLSEVAELVVVGRRAASGLERMFVGSTSVAVVANASCPVVVISAAAHPDPIGGRGIVGVGLQTSPGSEKTLEAGFQQAQRLGARLEVVHAIQPPVGLFARKLSPNELDEQVRFAKGGIEAIANEVAQSYPDVQYRVEVAADSPINELVSRSAGYDLLVVGVGDSHIPGLSLGGLMRGLLAHAECPLFVARG
ncbi:universal stress protein [Tessaracoccus sp. MC1865]|uniref:universal stress protein n=1 Tax=Tessaracoccus sp. MC1865 TaxID=2760310 RepID=UPI001603C6E3|nr:universal stress protein [Tessaracoccus sp. MC1865]MBB1484939.1 universal stress protein [Tessaracoccus sp. MC1865]QTO38628.1 universal stress protein [Tessaracoccus sp. MC1865]